MRAVAYDEFWGDNLISLLAEASLKLYRRLQIECWRADGAAALYRQLEM